MRERVNSMDNNTQLIIQKDSINKILVQTDSMITVLLAYDNLNDLSANTIEGILWASSDLIAKLKLEITEIFELKK